MSNKLIDQLEKQKSTPMKFLILLVILIKQKFMGW